MKTKTIQLYEFDELSEEAKAKVLENNRDINVDDSHWYSFVYDDWKERLEGMGFEDPQISFLSFWSQGDGASFTSKRVDVLKFLTAQKAKGRFKSILKAIKADKAEVNASVGRIDRRYSHEHAVKAYVEYYSTEDRFSADENLADELRDFIADTVRTLSRKIYRELEEEYDGLVSDEAVIDTIKANEYTFRSNGSIESY